MRESDEFPRHYLYINFLDIVGTFKLIWLCRILCGFFNVFTVSIKRSITLQTLAFRGEEVRPGQLNRLTFIGKVTHLTFIEKSGSLAPRVASVRQLKSKNDFICQQGWTRRFRFSNCPAPAPLAASVLRSPPYDKSSTNALTLFVFPLSQLERSRPYADEQGASAFLLVQLQRLGARVISQAVKKVKKQPSSRLVLCLSPLDKALPLFDLVNISILFSFFIFCAKCYNVVMES